MPFMWICMLDLCAVWVCCYIGLMLSLNENQIWGSQFYSPLMWLIYGFPQKLQACPSIKIAIKWALCLEGLLGYLTSIQIYAMDIIFNYLNLNVSEKSCFICQFGITKEAKMQLNYFIYKKYQVYSIYYYMSNMFNIKPAKHQHVSRSDCFVTALSQSYSHGCRQPC